MELPDFLVDHKDGEIRLVNHRISLYDVIHRYQEGYSPEMLREEYPTLPQSLIADVIDFYRSNRKEVDAYVLDYRRELLLQENSHSPSSAAKKIRRSLNAKSKQAAADLDK